MAVELCGRKYLVKNVIYKSQHPPVYLYPLCFWDLRSGVYLAVTGKGIRTGTAIGVGCVIYKSQHPPVYLYPLCFWDLRSGVYLAVTGKGIRTGTAIGVGCVIYKSQHPPVYLYPLCFWDSMGEKGFQPSTLVRLWSRSQVWLRLILSELFSVRACDCVARYKHDTTI